MVEDGEDIKNGQVEIPLWLLAPVTLGIFAWIIYDHDQMLKAPRGVYYKNSQSAGIVNTIKITIKNYFNRIIGKFYEWRYRKSNWKEVVKWDDVEISFDSNTIGRKMRIKKIGREFYYYKNFWRANFYGPPADTAVLRMENYDGSIFLRYFDDERVFCREVADVVRSVNKSSRDIRLHLLKAIEEKVLDWMDSRSFTCSKTMSLDELAQFFEEFSLDKSLVTLVPDPMFADRQQCLPDLPLEFINYDIPGPFSEMVCSVSTAVTLIFRYIISHVDWNCNPDELKDLTEALKAELLKLVHSGKMEQSGTYVRFEDLQTSAHDLCQNRTLCSRERKDEETEMRRVFEYKSDEYFINKKTKCGSSARTALTCLMREWINDVLGDCELADAIRFAVKELRDPNCQQSKEEKIRKEVENEWKERFEMMEKKLKNEEEMKSKMQAITKENKAIKDSNEELKREKEQLKESKDQCQAILEQMEQKIMELREQGQKATSEARRIEEMQAITKENKALRGIIEEVEKEKEKLDVSKDQLKAVLDQKDLEIMEFREQGQQATSEARLLIKEKEQLKMEQLKPCDKCYRTHQKCEEAKNQLKSSENKLKKIENKLETTEKLLNEYKDKEASIRDQVQDEWKERFEAMEKKLKDEKEMKNKVQTATKENKALRGIIEEVEKEKEKLEVSKNQLQAILEQKEQEIVKLREQGQKATSEARFKDIRIEDLTKTYSRLIEENQKLKKTPPSNSGDPSSSQSSSSQPESHTGGATDHLKKLFMKLVDTKNRHLQEQRGIQAAEKVQKIERLSEDPMIRRQADLELKKYNLENQKYIDSLTKSINDLKDVMEFLVLSDAPELSNEFMTAYDEALARELLKELGPDELTDRECLICTENMNGSEKTLKCDKCRRRYHVPCVGKWLTEHTGCPVCKRNMRDLDKYPELAPYRS